MSLGAVMGSSSLDMDLSSGRLMLNRSGFEGGGSGSERRMLDASVTSPLSELDIVVVNMSSVSVVSCSSIVAIYLWIAIY